MQKSFAIFAFSVFVATSSHAAQATLATRIHYEGEIAPRGELATIVISVYADKEATEPLWSEEQLVRVDAKGKFAVDIGATTDAGIPAEVFASTNARWVGIAVKGELEQPRIMIVSVPYAAKARDAETIGGKSIAELLRGAEFREQVKTALKEIAEEQQQQMPQQRAPQVRQTIFTGLTKEDSSLQKQTNSVVAAAGTFEFLPTTGVGAGIFGRTNSTTSGNVLAGASGIVGEVTPTSPGSYSAGVRGINNGTGGGGIGVIGSQAGSGWGVFGSAPNGAGVYGFSQGGIGVIAGTTAGTVALQLENGAIKVSGTTRFMFQATVTLGTVYISGLAPQNGYVIDNPLTNGDPNAIVMVQTAGHVTSGGIFPGLYANDPTPVFAAYSTYQDKWCILHLSEDGATYYTNPVFNVLVIKQ